jgi:outer membrane protein assembly factor BamD
MSHQRPLPTTRLAAAQRSRLRRGGRVAALVLLVVSGAVTGACKSGGKDDPVMQLAAAESLTEGQRLMKEEKYSQARRYLTHAFEIEPNSISGREALLLVADSLYLQGGSDNLIQAEAKYRDFLNRFPTSDRAPYVQLQIGNSLAGRVERPDRDQSVTVEAVIAFEELLRLYPTSEEATLAQGRIVDLRQRLAEHEFIVGWFYYRFGLPTATVSRLQELLVVYPEYTEKDKVYYHLGLAFQKMRKQEEASKWFDRLREEYPASEFVSDIPPPGEVRG